MFLEGLSSSVVHESFRESISALNDAEDVLNATRVDPDMQYSVGNSFDAHIKACTEMTYK